MNRNRFIALAWLASSFVTAGMAQDAAQPPREKSPLLGEGYFQQVRRPLEQMFPFTFEGPRLILDRKSSARNAKEGPKPARAIRLTHPLEAAFQQLQFASRASSGGSSASSTERWLHFSGTNLSGRLHSREGGIRVVLEEPQAPQRAIEFNDDGQGALRLQVTHPDGDLILLQQSRKGNFAVVAIMGGQSFAGQAESFMAVFRRHRDVMEDRVLPVLEQFGIQPVLSPHTPQVRRAVLAELVRSPKSEEEARALFADLDSDQYETRDKASRQLREKFEAYQYLIQEKLRDKSISAEVQARLTAILAQHTDAQRVAQTVAALDLLQDAKYLVSLLDHAAAEDVPKVTSQLEKTTGQKLGSDPKAWKEWAAKER